MDKRMAVRTNDRKVVNTRQRRRIFQGELLLVMYLEHPSSIPAEQPRKVRSATFAYAIRAAKRLVPQPSVSTSADGRGFASQSFKN
jgi:hypothetical protein